MWKYPGYSVVFECTWIKELHMTVASVWSAPRSELQVTKFYGCSKWLNDRRVHRNADHKRCDAFSVAVRLHNLLSNINVHGNFIFFTTVFNTVARHQGITTRLQEMRFLCDVYHADKMLPSNWYQKLKAGYVLQRLKLVMFPQKSWEVKFLLPKEVFAIN